jgi:hypothetical protein
VTVDWSDELSEAADELLLAAPAVEPPAGFEDRVLERIHRRPRRRGLARRPAWAAASAAAVLLVIGGITGAVVGRSTSDDDGGSRLRTVQLISSSGADIGDVSTIAGSSPWFFMRLEGELPDGTYRCVLEMDDGRTVPVGRLWAVSGHGGWGEHVDVDLRHARLARLLDRQGTTVATALLG